MNNEYEAIELHRATLVSRELLSLHNSMDGLAEEERICPCVFNVGETYRGEDVICIVAHSANDCTSLRIWYQMLRVYIVRGGEYVGNLETESCSDVPKIKRHPALTAAFQAAGGRNQKMDHLYAGFGPGEEVCITGFMLNRMNKKSMHLFFVARKTTTPPSLGKIGRRLRLLKKVTKVRVSLNCNTRTSEKKDRDEPALDPREDAS